MKKLGVFGLGAFGQLMVKHLIPYVEVLACDPSPAAQSFAKHYRVRLAPLEEVAACDYVVFAVPVPAFEEVVRSVVPYLKKGSIVLDVCSVKVKPAAILKKELPEHIEILCTHPLWGPQSAKDGLKGLKTVLCPVRGRHHRFIGKFLEKAFEMQIIEATPEEHDREVAMAQGLTHMIAKVLVDLEPLPAKITTRSFDLLMQAVEMVRYDSMELFLAIERDNPFSSALRRRFFEKADELRAFLESHESPSS